MKSMIQLWMKGYQGQQSPAEKKINDIDDTTVDEGLSGTAVTHIKENQ